MADLFTRRGLSMERRRQALTWSMVGRRQALTWSMVALAALFAVACAPPSPAPSTGRGVGEGPSAPAPSGRTTGQPSPSAQPAADPTPRPAPTVVADLSRANFSTSGWKTDFSRTSVPLDEISSGGPPRDGIPPIDRPKLIPSSEADGWLKDNEPVVAFTLQGEARAYPLQVLTWHEIVNDEVAGVPVAVTFCPLCNSAIAFDRRVEGQGALRFGTTGNLRHSDLVMWDDKTESWWQQLTGEAIVGQLTGTRLSMLPAAIVSYRDFKATYPQGTVLSRDTGHVRAYGSNPYIGYDDINDSPFLFRGKPDGRLKPMERVVAVELGGQTAAYPFSVLQQHGVVHDTVGGVPIVVFWAKGTASALDNAIIAGSRDVGATGVFRPSVDGKSPAFTLRDGAIVDRETGTVWNVLGQAVSGPSQGKRLEPVVHATHFWFAWAAFKPETRIYRP